MAYTPPSVSKRLAEARARAYGKTPAQVKAANAAKLAAVVAATKKEGK